MRLHYISLCVLFGLIAVSCVLDQSVPPEEYYARNYGDVQRPGAEDELDQLNINDERGIGGEENRELEQAFDVERRVEQTADENAGTPAVSDDIYAQQGAAGESQVPDGSDAGGPVLLSPDQVAEGMSPGESLGAEKTPPGSLVDPIGQKGFQSLEDKIFNTIEKAYEDRDPEIFKNAYAQFVRMFPASNYLGQIQDYRDRFFLREALLTSPLQGGIIDLGFLTDSDYPRLDAYLELAKNLGFSSILWKPYVNLADYNLTPPPKRGDVGTLYAGRIAPMYADRLPQVLEAARKHGLKVFLAFPLRDHPWIRFNQKRLPEDTWFPGNSAYGMDAVLNLLHPEIRPYLRDMLRELVAQRIDGIIFENDFTHHMFEGFHELNLLIYEDEIYEESLNVNSGRYNRNVQPRTHFRGNIQNGRDHDFAYERQINSDIYQDYVTWRINRIGKLLTSLIGDLRMMDETLQIGVRTAPTLINNKTEAIKVYGTSPEFAVNLPADFVILDRNLYGRYASSTPESYENAALKLEQMVDREKTVFVSNRLSTNATVPVINRTNEEVERVRKLVSAKGVMIGNLMPYIRKETAPAKSNPLLATK